MSIRRLPSVDKYACLRQSAVRFHNTAVAQRVSDLTTLNSVQSQDPDG